ncbi:MAG: aminotransferase class V-fold PLP-dependent enzyme [Candidatus Melainabacteria bacterium]|nr:aminotransferase class V-fold PLP-dependent enzyme [Candidatus Melainabacteria bacterium]
MQLSVNSTPVTSNAEVSDILSQASIPHCGSDRWAEHFPILTQGSYLASHSMGAMPLQAQDYLQSYLQQWSSQGISAWDDTWPRLIASHAGLIETLICAPQPNTVTFHQNVSTLLAIVSSAIVRPNNTRWKVVATTLNFPSLLYHWQCMLPFGIELVEISSRDGATIALQDWEAAIDENTLAVLVDHGIFLSGALQDARAITQLAHAKGAYSLVDVYQTAGCVPVDVTDWQADFVLGGSHKWLCGGPGAAWLYIRPEHLKTLVPSITGWFSHQQPFAFHRQFEPADHAARFSTATASIPALLSARAGLEWILRVGVDPIRSYTQVQTQRVIDAALSLGVLVRTPQDPKQRSGVVCLDWPGAAAFEKRLLAEGFWVDYRPGGGLRLSTHFYTPPHSVDRFLEALQQDVTTG